jgi:hypothetical protein
MKSDIETLIQMLHSVTEYDVIDCGYDNEGHKCYAIRNLAKSPSVLLLGNLQASDFPEWLGKNKN